MLLLAFTPREPSLCTTNMLRSAHRAGLKAKLISGKGTCPRDGTGNCNPLPSSPCNADARRDSHRSVAFDVGVGERERASSPLGFYTSDSNVARGPRIRTGHSSRPTSTLGDAPGHPPDMAYAKERLPPSRQNPPWTTRPTREGRRPVLLSFQLSMTAMDRDYSGTFMDIGGKRDYCGRPSRSAPESTWLSEWDDIISHLGVRYSDSHQGEASITPLIPPASSCQTGKAAPFYHERCAGVGSADDVTVTAEYLWGPESKRGGNEI